MKFSIIVPVYNVESYLQTCIESVLSQSFKDFELILCDDGSTDSSGKICDNAAVVDSRINVLHLNNGGPSAARNAGISISKGEYIFFLDSDDRMCKDILLQLNDILVQNDNLDSVVGTFLNWDGCEKTWESSDITQIVKSQNGKSFFEINEMYAEADIQLPWCVYQMVTKRQIYVENKLLFDTQTNSAEDLDFYMKTIKYINFYKLVNIPFVYYRVGRVGSIVTELKFSSFYGELVFFIKTYNGVNDFPHPIIMKRYFADEFSDRIMKIARLHGDEKSKAISLIKENWYITKDTTDRIKFKIAKFLWKTFGLYLGSKLLYCLWLIKNKL